MKVSGRKRLAVALLATAAVMIAAVADGAVASQTPLVGAQPNNTVRDMIVVGNTAYIGGQFTSITPAGGGAAVTRNHAAAIDMTTGAVLPWNPNVNGVVYTMLANGSNVYIGGSFTTVGGATHKNLAEVNATSGAVVTAFTNSSKPNAEVRALTMANGNLYVGGAFTTPRNYLFETNATTNTYIPTWAPVVDDQVRALATDTSQTRIVEGGYQQCATGSGCDGRIGIGAVNTTDGSFVPFAYAGPPTFVPPPGFPYRPWQALAFVQDGNTLFVSASGNGGTLLSLDMDTGNLNWQAGFDGNVVGAGVTDGVVYAGGHFHYYCGPIPGNNFVCSGLSTAANRLHLAAFDEGTGAIESWNPSVNTDLGIEAVGAANNRVAVGGEFTAIGTTNVSHFARFAESGGGTVTITDPTVTDNSASQPATGPVTVTASGSTSSAGGSVSYRYQTSTNGGATWSASTTGNSVTISAAGTTVVQFQAFQGTTTSNWVQDTVTISSGGGGGTGTVTLHLSKTASVGSGGNVTVKGTYTCNGASSVTISGTVTESSAGASGTFTTTVPCPNNTTATSWSALAKHGSGPAFTSGGSAAINAQFSATDSGTNQPITGSQDLTVTLS